MIVVRLKSGMGNQMFQYAFGILLAKKLNTSVKFDLTALIDRSRGPNFVYRNYDLEIFNVTPEFTHSRSLLEFLSKFKSSSITKFFRNRVRNNKKYYKEPSFDFQKDIVDHPEDETVYEGWFQSYKYLSEIENEIRSAFKFKSNIIQDSKSLFERIENTNAVCLNVRRTDFVKTDNLNTTDLSYFENAVTYIAKNVENPTFYIFSDDIDWCNENIKLNHPMEVVDHSHKGYKFGNYLQLMTKCKHFIIPNSSFAWWAVWLSIHKNKLVVAPKTWFNDASINTEDLIPKEWKRL